MPAPPTTHPTDAALGEFVVGRLPDPDDAAVALHLAGCPRCQARAAGLRPDDTLASLVAAVGTRADSLHTDVPAADYTPPEHHPTVEWIGTAPGSAAGIPAGLVGHPRYRLVRPLGEGGMGSVWLAEHAVMGRMVALKVIHPAVLARPGAVEQFRREVRAAARLHHPNIVTAFDADEAGGTHFLVMEFVPGESLLEAVRRGPLPADEACRAVRDAARGLAHAHAAGLIHRDVKPGNLIRAADGTVKVLDFGLVGLAAGGDGLTGENVTMGTPDYIAPEQATDAGAADARSDVYALGCTLYHLLAGRVPYPAGSTLQKLDAHRDPHVRPAPVPGLPPSLAAVLARMTATDPAARYPTAAAAAEALESCCTAVAVPPPRRPRVWPWVAAAAGLVFALLALGAVYTVHRGNEVVTVETDDPDVEVTMRRNGEVIRITDAKTKRAWELDAKNFRLAPDGGELTLDLPDGAPLVLRRNGAVVATVRRAPAAAPAAPAGSEVRRLGGITEAVHTVAFSPDGKWVVAAGGHHWGRGFVSFRRGGDFVVRVWDVATGGLVHTLAGHTELVSCVVFSPDGTRLATAGGDKTVRVWDAATGKQTATIDRPGTVAGVAFTPDGRAVLAPATLGPLRLFDAATGREDAGFRPAAGVAEDSNAVGFAPDGRTLVAGGWPAAVLERATGKTVRLFRPLTRVVVAAYSRDGARILTVDVPDRNWAAGMVRVCDAATGTELWNHPGTAAAFASADGVRVLTAAADGRLTLRDTRTGAALADLPGHTSTVVAVAVSPDGRFAVSGGLDDTARLWELPALAAPPAPPAATGDVRPFRVFAGHHKSVLAVKFGPDGKSLYSAGHDGFVRAWDVDAGKDRVAFDHGVRVLSIALADRGKLLLSVAHADRPPFRLRAWDTASGKEVEGFPEVSAAENLCTVAASPDGTQAATVAINGTVRVWDVAGRKLVRAFAAIESTPAYSVAWSPDAKLLAVTGTDGIAVCDAATGRRVHRVTDLGVHGQTTIAFTPDGGHVLTAGWEGIVRAYDRDTWRLERTLTTAEGRGLAGTHLTTAPDGRLLLAAHTREVRVWDVAADRRLFRLVGDGLDSVTPAVSPDGRRAAAGSDNGKVFVWELPPTRDP